MYEPVLPVLLTISGLCTIIMMIYELFPLAPNDDSSACFGFPYNLVQVCKFESFVLQFPLPLVVPPLLPYYTCILCKLQCICYLSSSTNLLQSLAIPLDLSISIMIFIHSTQTIDNYKTYKKTIKRHLSDPAHWSPRQSHRYCPRHLPVAGKLEMWQQLRFPHFPQSNLAQKSNWICS